MGTPSIEAIMELLLRSTPQQREDVFAYLIGNKPTPEKVYTNKEAREMLKMSPSTFWRRMKQHNLTTAGRKHYFLTDSMIAVLSQGVK